DPLHYAEPFVRAGSDNLTFHIEVAEEPLRVIERIRSAGASVGLALNPGTPAGAIAHLCTHVDLVLVMSVWPGFGGQRFIGSALEKLERVRGMLRKDQRLEVDGGIDGSTVAQCAAAGADTFVAGTAVFGHRDPIA